MAHVISRHQFQLSYGGNTSAPRLISRHQFQLYYGGNTSAPWLMSYLATNSSFLMVVTHQHRADLTVGLLSLIPLLQGVG
jgi:non-ribosomal peptide synthetase component E (peptide arylation enzyme)